MKISCLRWPVAVLGWLLPLVGAAAEVPSARPWELPALNIESGLLWEVGHSTPFAYRLLSTQVSWRSRELLGHEFAGGSRLVVRHRRTLIGTSIANGPESRYVALAGSPSVEWWDPTGAWSWFTGSGGGCGVIDSRGVPGGQGQDFTPNWFIRSGVEHFTARHLRWSASLLFQHLSHGGMTEPNPGINALGVLRGTSWNY